MRIEWLQEEIALKNVNKINFLYETKIGKLIQTYEMQENTESLSLSISVLIF